MKSYKKYGVYAALLFGVLVVVMLFISPAIKIVSPTEVNWKNNGFQAIFGTEKGMRPHGFEPLGFFALIFLVAGLAASFVPTIPLKLRYLIGAVLLLISGIFFFVFPSMIGNGIKAATPLILTGVFALLAAVVDGSLALLEFLKK